MFKTKTLDQILYKEKHYSIGSTINVEDKDVNKLIKLGAIDGSGFKKPETKKTNTIKNPIKVEDIDDSFEEIEETEETDDIISEADKKESILKSKRKYNKRGDDSDIVRDRRF